MEARALGGDQELIARLDRIPCWPYRHLLLAIIGAGYFFSFFDIVNIGFALPVIAKEFGVSEGIAAWSVTASLIGYIVGAYLDATIADRWGRRLSLALSVSVFSIGSIGAALSPSLSWLIGWRFFAGMGIGAEIAGVTTYMGEISPAAVRGRYTSWATTAAYAGFAVVPFVARALVPTFDYGWRILFLIGAAGGLTVLFMRRGIPASPRWLLSRGRREEAEEVVRSAEERARSRVGGELPEPEPVAEEPPARKFPTLALLKPPYIQRVVLFLTIWFLYYIGNYGWLTLGPTLFGKEGFTLTESITYLIVSGIGFVVGAAGTTMFTDRFERKVSLIVVAVLWAVNLVVIGLFVSPTIIMVFGFLASVTIGLLVPVMYTLTAEHFSTTARATGVALTDGLGHVGGAIAPIVILWAADTAGFGAAFIAMAASGVATALLLPFAVRATGRSLETATAAGPATA